MKVFKVLLHVFLAVAFGVSALAQPARATFNGAGLRSYTVSAATLTFNPSDKSSGITLSGSDLIATNSGAVADRAVRMTVGRSSGKYVYSLTVTDFATGDDMALGLATSTHPLNVRLQNATTAFRWSDQGFVDWNFGTDFATGVPTWVEGDTLYLAIDFADGIWIKVNSGDWNNDPTADPDTGVGEYDLPGALVGPTLYPIASFWNVDGIWTLNPTATGHGLSTFTVW